MPGQVNCSLLPGWFELAQLAGPPINFLVVCICLQHARSSKLQFTSWLCVSRPPGQPPALETPPPAPGSRSPWKPPPAPRQHHVIPGPPSWRPPASPHPGDPPASPAQPVPHPAYIHFCQLSMYVKSAPCPLGVLRYPSTQPQGLGAGSLHGRISGWPKTIISYTTFLCVCEYVYFATDYHISLPQFIDEWLDNCQNFPGRTLLCRNLGLPHSHLVLMYVVPVWFSACPLIHVYIRQVTPVSNVPVVAAGNGCRWCIQTIIQV